MGLSSPFRIEPITPDLLLPILRPRSSLALEALADRIFGGDGADVPVLGHVGSDLAITLAAAGRPDATLVDSGHLRTLGLAAETAFELGVANLLRRSEARFKARGQGLFASDWNDGFDSSRLLLPHLFGGLPLAGDAVALVPMRGQLLVTGADDHDGLLALAEAAAEALSTTDRPLSAQALRLRNGVWTRFTPDPAKLFTLLDLMRGQWIRDYAEQKQLLDQLHAQDDDQVVVADEVAMQDRRTGRPFCLTFWIDGAPSLLPQADVIAFRTAADVILVPWEAALPIVGGRLSKTDHYPARYRADHFPPPADLERLRSVATFAKPLRSAGVDSVR